jgi:hypothetical protein
MVVRTESLRAQSARHRVDRPRSVGEVALIRCTMGMVLVAFMTARAAGVVTTMIMSTLSRSGGGTRDHGSAEGTLTRAASVVAANAPSSHRPTTVSMGRGPPLWGRSAFNCSFIVFLTRLRVTANPGACSAMTRLPPRVPLRSRPKCLSCVWVPLPAGGSSLRACLHQPGICALRLRPINLL